jgi:acyl-CoA synthetase (AMP-forming)/AMP-acid ligase II
MTGHPLGERIRHVLALQPDAPAIEYEDSWATWGQLAEFAAHIEELVVDAGGRPQVGVLLRNRPPHVATLLGVLMAGATLVVVNPSRGDDRTRADITALDLPLVVGAPDDVAALVTPSSRTAIVTITELDETVVVTPATARSTDAGRSGVAVRMLTSGTTGPPKRIDLTYDMLARSVMGKDPANVPAPQEIRRGVAIVNAPLVHIGGVFRVLQCVAEARPFVLLARFELDRWTAAVHTHRPRAVSLVPAALRMVLHSDLTRDDLSSIQAVTSGTAPLSADDAEAFTERFGIPVLTSYAATGFLWILGRADQAIIRGGFKVMPDDVRTALEQHPAVLGAAVVGRPDERLGETPVAMVELRGGVSVGTDELAAYLGTRLARYEIPTELAIVAHIPRTPSGKADLTAVRSHFAEPTSVTQGGHG